MTTLTTGADRRRMRAMRAEGSAYKDIAAAFGVPYHIAYSVTSRVTLPPKSVSVLDEVARLFLIEPYCRLCGLAQSHDPDSGEPWCPNHRLEPHPFSQPTRRNQS